jgi:uncharacterized alkaline shock family protein YloU
VSVAPTTAPGVDATRGPARTEELVTRRGETSIAPSVIATVAKQAAGEVAGVEVVSGGGLRGLVDTLRPDRAAGARAEVASRQTAVELTVAVCWPLPVGDVTDKIRSHVKARVHELTGYAVTDVDIAVDALPSPSRRRRVQ